MDDGKQLLVHFDTKIDSDNLFCNMGINVPVKGPPHKSFSYSKCVIWCKELANIDGEDIVNELK